MEGFNREIIALVKPQTRESFSFFVIEITYTLINKSTNKGISSYQKFPKENRSPQLCLGRLGGERRSFLHPMRWQQGWILWVSTHLSLKKNLSKTNMRSISYLITNIKNELYSNRSNRPSWKPNSLYPFSNLRAMSIAKAISKNIPVFRNPN